MWRMHACESMWCLSAACSSAALWTLCAGVCWPSVHVCITAGCNNAPGACPRVCIQFSHVCECVCVFYKRGLGVRMNKQVPSQALDLHGHWGRKQLSHAFYKPREAVWLIDGLIMVPLQQGSKLVDALTQGWWGLEESKSTGPGFANYYSLKKGERKGL